MRRFVSYGPAIIVSLTILLALAIVPMTVREATYAATRAKVTLARQALQDGDILKQLDEAFTRIAEATAPSVVHIDVRSRTGRRRMSGATGAGWVFDDQGHIVGMEVLDATDRLGLESLLNVSIENMPVEKIPL